MPTNSIVSFACRDERGHFLGTFDQVVLDAPDRHFVSAMGNRKALRFALEHRTYDNRVRVGRRYFRSIKRSCFCGNLMWDAVTMPTQDARRLLAFLVADGWQLTEATNGNPFTGEIDYP